MEIEFIEKFVKDAFPRLPVEERQELINTAWIFLAENNILQVSELDDETLKKLKKRLSSELNQVTWHEIGIEDLKRPWGSDGKLSINEDEMLSYFKEQSEQINQFEISRELENATAVFESQKENLKLLLPPLLFEALHRKIDIDAPVNLTAGFEEQSLKVLCRRALLRIQWLDV